MDEIGHGTNPISVCVLSSDLQAAPNAPKLLKFHGCAVRARDDEATYRPRIVSRDAQFANWVNDERIKGLVQHLEVTIGERPTFMLGLSAQDFNIKHLFGAARTKLSWTWPGDRPSYVFSEDKLTSGQATILQIVYGEKFNGSARKEIKSKSLLRAFAKPLLLALVLYVLCAKLIRLAQLFFKSAEGSMSDWIGQGIVALRDSIARHDNGDRVAFAEGLIRHLTRFRRLASVGEAEVTSALTYEPLTTQSVSTIRANTELESNGIPETGVALAILGHGIAGGFWTIAESSVLDAHAPMAVVKSSHGESCLFFAATERAEQTFYAQGRLRKDDDAILIRAQPRYSRQQRSPSNRHRRTGKAGTREVSIPTLFQGSPAPQEVMARFRLEASL